MIKVKTMALAAVVALTALSTVSAPASAGGKAVSLKGTGTGTIRLDTATGDFTGKESGTISHLGKYRLRLQGHATQSPDGSFTGNGTVTITAANGDRLTGTFTLTGRDGTQRVVVTVTGGTGRFAHARGTLTVICVSDPPRQEGQTLILPHHCTTKGKISY
jgi:VCBS repeat-containing protein